MRNLRYFILAGILGLSSWTLYKVNQLTVAVGKIEQNEEWVKMILTRQADKLDKQPR